MHALRDEWRRSVRLYTSNRSTRMRRQELAIVLFQPCNRQTPLGRPGQVLVCATRHFVKTAITHIFLFKRFVPQRRAACVIPAE